MTWNEFESHLKFQGRIAAHLIGRLKQNRQWEGEVAFVWFDAQINEIWIAKPTFANSDHLYGYLTMRTSWPARLWTSQDKEGKERKGRKIWGYLERKVHDHLVPIHEQYLQNQIARGDHEGIPDFRIRHLQDFTPSIVKKRAEKIAIELEQLLSDYGSGI